MRLFTALLCVLILPAAHAQFTQQGGKLTGIGAFGSAVAVSADGNTAIVGAPDDTVAWILTRINGVWSQPGIRLAGAGLVGTTRFGTAVAISADGNTAVVGGWTDNSQNGAAWVFIRLNNTWRQLGGKLTAADATGAAGLGWSVAISGDGHTVAAGGPNDNGGAGAVWVFTLGNGVWMQQGAKLVGAGAVGAAGQGSSVALSADASTILAGGYQDRGGVGAAWVFTQNSGVWSQQAKLIGSGAVGASWEGYSAALSRDGSTAIIGGYYDNAWIGAAWVFARTNGVWIQQGKLVGTGVVGTSEQGRSVAISGDGSTAVVGGFGNDGSIGGAWVFARTNGAWTQQGAELLGSGAAGNANQGYSVALSADGRTLISGGRLDNAGSGAVWIFTAPPAPPSPLEVSPASGSGSSAAFTLTFSDPRGWQSLSVVNVLFRSVLDGRQACYLAFVPSSPTTGSLYLVDDAGDAGGPYAGNGNSQCRINSTDARAAGTTLTLTLSLTFTPGFAGNQVIYLAAQDAVGSSGWQALGTWSVPGPSPAGPAAGGVTPPRTRGLRQTYTFTFTDTNGWQDIAVANVLIASAIDGSGACYLAFVPAGAGSGTVQLVDDAGDAQGPYASLPMPSFLTASNSQCTIAGTGSAALSAGNTLALTLNITFKPGFAGNHVIYLAARSKTQNSGWQPLGTVTVADTAVPLITALDPSSIQAGQPGFLTLTVSGTTFQDNVACPAFCGAACASRSVVAFDHVNVSTFFVSDTQLHALVPASLLVTPRTVDVTVNNPVVIQCQGSEDHVSAPAPFTILP